MYRIGFSLYVFWAHEFISSNRKNYANNYRKLILQSVASDLAEEAVTGEQDLLLPIGLRCRIKYPNKIPVYIHKTPRCTINDLDKRRYLVPSEMTIGQFFSLIRRRISVRPEQGVFFLVAGAHIPSITSTMGEVYREHSENYMLHITYSEESAYGR